MRAASPLLPFLRRSILLLPFLRRPILILPLLAVGALLIESWPAEGSIRNNRTQFDRIRDCETIARQEFSRRDPGFQRFVIDRSSVRRESYGAYIGNRFVAAVYHGRAIYETSGSADTTRFVCLHGGMGRRALFVGRLPDLD